MSKITRVPVTIQSVGNLPFSLRGPMVTPIWIMSGQYKALVSMKHDVTLHKASLKAVGLTVDEVHEELDMVSAEVLQKRADDLRVNNAKRAAETAAVRAEVLEEETEEEVEETEAQPEPAPVVEEKQPEAQPEPEVAGEPEDEAEEEYEPYTYDELKALTKAEQLQILDDNEIEYPSKTNEEERIQLILAAQEEGEE